MLILRNRLLTRLAMAVTLPLAGTSGRAEILMTNASVSSDNALIVDIQVVTSDDVAKIVATYQAPGIEPLMSPFVPVSTTGQTTITIGRLRANKPYTYTLRALNKRGAAPFTE